VDRISAALTTESGLGRKEDMGGELVEHTEGKLAGFR
jgi:hypothetical protein